MDKSEIPVVSGSFFAINREERFFCALLTHALLSSAYVRERFYGFVHERTHIWLDAGEDLTEVYTEVAWLRDHWRNLGDPQKWTSELEAARIKMLSGCLAALGSSLEHVVGQKFFRTAGKLPKVVTPGRWPLQELGEDEALKTLKWAFNAIPDFVFISGDRAVIVEAKIESQPGKSSSGYSQDGVQEALRRLIPTVAPYLHEGRTGRLWIARTPIASNARTILWADIAQIVEAVPTGELDQFSRVGLKKFAQRAHAGDAAV